MQTVFQKSEHNSGPDPNRNYEAAVPIHGYTVLKPRSSRVSIGFWNLSCRQVTILAKSVFAKIAAANVIPHSYAPNIKSKDQLQLHQGPKIVNNNQ